MVVNNLVYHTSREQTKEPLKETNRMRGTYPDHKMCPQKDGGKSSHFNFTNSKINFHDDFLFLIGRNIEDPY